MGAPTTLLALANLIQTSAAAEQAFFQSEAGAARTELAQTVQDLSDAVAAKAALEQEVAAARQAVLDATSEAAAQAALGDLWSKLADVRFQSTEIAALERDRAVLQARLDGSSQTASQSASRVTQAAAQVTAATKASVTQAADDAKLAGPPLSSLASDANRRLNTAPDNAPYLAAKARIEADIPLELRQRATQRWNGFKSGISVAAGLPVHVAGLQQSMLTSAGNSEDRLAIPKSAYETSRLPLDQFRLNGPLSLDRAAALFARVADPTVAPLTADQTAAIADAATDGAPAAQLEKARDDKRAELDAAEAALQKAVLTARAADFDADPSTVQAVIDAEGVVTTLEGELATAETAFDAAEKTALDTWEAAVPEATWKLYADFLDGESALQALAGVNTGTLTTARNTAEATYAQALAAEDKRLRLERFLAYEKSVADAAAKYDSESAGVRLVQALRGDA